MGLPEEDEVTKGPHCAKAAALREKTHKQGPAEGIEQGGVHGTRPLHGIEQNAVFAFPGYLRKEQKQRDKAKHQRRHDKAAFRALGCVSAKRIAAPEKERAYAHAADEPGQTGKGVEITARKPKQSAPGAAEKDQGPDHGAGTQHKTHQGGRARPGLKLAKTQGREKRTQQKGRYLGPQVLHYFRPVQPQSSGNIPFKAGNAQAHVGRITRVLQADGNGRHNRTTCRNTDPSRKPVRLHLHLLLLCIAVLLLSTMVYKKDRTFCSY